MQLVFKVHVAIFKYVISFLCMVFGAQERQCHLVQSSVLLRWEHQDLDYLQAQTPNII